LAFLLFGQSVLIYTNCTGFSRQSVYSLLNSLLPDFVMDSPSSPPPSLEPFSRQFPPPPPPPNHRIPVGLKSAPPPCHGTLAVTPKINPRLGLALFCSVFPLSPLAQDWRVLAFHSCPTHPVWGMGLLRCLPPRSERNIVFFRSRFFSTLTLFTFFLFGPTIWAYELHGEF